MDPEIEFGDDEPELFLRRDGPSPFTNWLSPGSSGPGSSSSDGLTPTNRQRNPSLPPSGLPPLPRRAMTPQLQTPPPPRLEPQPNSRRARGPFHDPEVESFLQESQRRQAGLAMESNDEDESSLTIMALFYQKQQLAVSLFNVEDSVLHVCQFHYWPKNGECALLQNLVLEHRVGKVVVASNLDKGLLDEVKEISSQVPHQLQLSAVGTKEFTLESAIFRIRMLRYENQELSGGGFHTPFDDLSALDDPLILRSLGALLSFALKESIVNELEGASSPIIISEIKVIESTGRLLMDIGSYDSLQIFKVEHHPSVSGIGVKKEG